MSEESLYESSLQLERLPERYEAPYQRGIRFMGRCMAPGLALFALVTLLEGATGILSRSTASFWLEAIHRPPSTFGGQGSLGVGSLVWMTRLQGERGPIRALFAGDSVLAPNLGGDTNNEVPPDDVAAARIPGALNLSQEGVEWGMNSLLLQRLEREAVIGRDQPLLVLDLNPKFFSYGGSFTPAFPVEIPLCARRPDPSDPDMDTVCASLRKDWPRALAALSGLSPTLLEAVQGQLDFFKTFVLRAPIYRLYERPRGIHSGRVFIPGWLDALTLKARYAVDPPRAQTLDYRGGGAGLSAFQRNVLAGAASPAHPKQPWLRSLERTLARWPGPVLVLWWELSPNAEAVLEPDVRQGFERIRERLTAELAAFGKKDLYVESNRAFLTEATDFTDSDHMTSRGHAKMAKYVDDYARRIGK